MTHDPKVTYMLATLDLKMARAYLQHEASPQARRIMLGASDETILASLHKARFEHPAILPVMRLDSKAWLIEHGFQRQGGRPWPTTASGLP